MTLAESPQPRRKHLPSAPSPSTVDLMVEDAIAKLRKQAEQYRWVYPSGYAPGRKGNGEKVRRDISGSGGDLANIVAGGKPGRETSLDMVRRHCEESGDHLRKALAHIGGSDTALGRAQEKIDAASKPTLVANDPLEPVSADKPFTPDHLRGMTPTEAKTQQAKRAKRVGERGEPWAHDEITG